MAGQLIQKGDRKWLVRVFMGRDPKTGKKHYYSRQINGNKKDAQKVLNGVLREIDMGIFVEPSSMTLGEYLDKWLESAARPRVSRRTADGYEGLLKRYIREPIGSRQLDNLKPLELSTGQKMIFETA